MLRNTPTNELREFVRATYGLDAREVALPAGRAHGEAAVYRVDTGEHSYFLKLTTRLVEQSPLARHLADSGVAEILAPLRTRDGQLSARLGGREASLYPFVEGENAFVTPLNEEQWTALGRIMRAVHDATLPATVAEAMRTEGFSDVWRKRVRAYLQAPPPGIRDDDVARGLLDLLAGETARIRALVEHAEQLADAARNALPRVPCHGDLHAGNVLIDRLGSLWIVDWDDPVLAPRERDLMFIGAGIGGAWNRDDESAAFYRGYGPITINAQALAYYRCERIVEDVAVFCDQLLLADDDAHVDRALLVRKLTSAFDPNDVVEIAENTVANL